MAGSVQLLRPSAETLRALAETFGLDGDPRRLVPISRGGNGRVWRLDLDGRDGPLSYAVKELFAGGDERRIAASVEFCDLATAAGIRAPFSLRTVGGNDLADVGGVVVRMASWVDGREPKPEDPGVAEWLGWALATLHTIGRMVDRSGHTPYDPPVPDPGVWFELAERGVAARRPWGASLLRAAPELARLGAKTRPLDPDRLVFSHHDVQPSNVLFDPESGEYTLLDWDGAGPIDPGRELASRLYTWHARAGHLDVPAARRTLRAYRSAGGPASIGEAEAYGGLPDALAYIAGQARASLDETLPTEMRDHSTRETRLLLSEPLSTSIFEEIVELGRTP